MFIFVKKLLKDNLSMYLTKLEDRIEKKDNHNILKIAKHNYNQSKKFYYYTNGEVLSKEDYKEMSLLANEQRNMELYEENPLGWDNTVVVNVIFNGVNYRCVVSLDKVVYNSYPNKEFCILSLIVPERTKERKMEIKKRQKEKRLAKKKLESKG